MHRQRAQTTIETLYTRVLRYVDVGLIKLRAHERFLRRPERLHKERLSRRRFGYPRGSQGDAKRGVSVLYARPP